MVTAPVWWVGPWVGLDGAGILHFLLFRRSPGVTNPRSDEAAEGRAGEDLGESGGHGLLEEKPRLLGEFDRHFEHNFIVQPEYRTAGSSCFFQQVDDADECQDSGVGALALDREVARLCVLLLIDLLVPGEAEDAADSAFGITPDDDVTASLACLRIVTAPGRELGVGKFEGTQPILCVMWENDPAVALPRGLHEGVGAHAVAAPKLTRLALSRSSPSASISSTLFPEIAAAVVVCKSSPCSNTRVMT